MHQFVRLSERGGNFLNLLQKERVPRNGGGRGGVPTLEETMINLVFISGDTPLPLIVMGGGTGTMYNQITFTFTKE